MAKAGIIPTTTQPQHNTSLGIYGFSVSYQFTLVFTLGFFPSSILDSDICKNTSLRSRQRWLTTVATPIIAKYGAYIETQDFRIEKYLVTL